MANLAPPAAPLSPQLAALRDVDKPLQLASAADDERDPVFGPYLRGEATLPAAGGGGPPPSGGLPGGGVPASGGPPPGGYPYQTQVPPPPESYRAVFNPAATAQLIAQSATAGLPTAGYEADMARYTAGDQLYVNDRTGHSYWAPYQYGPKDPGRIQYEEAMKASGATGGSRSAAAPYETVEATVMTPQGAVKMQVPRDQYNAAFTRQYGAPAGPSAGSAKTTPPPGPPGGAAPGGPGGAAPAGNGGPAAPAAGGLQLGGPPVLTPEQQKTSEAYGDQAAQNIAAANAAPDILGKVVVLRNAAKQFSENAFGGFGPSAQDRLNMANRFADIVTQLGGTAPKSLTDTISAGQIIGKEQGMLTAQLVRQLGSREAAQIYSATQNYTPGVTMSRGGYDAIVNSIEQGAQRDLDKANFQDRWLATHPSIAGMQDAFNKWMPIEVYASRVAPLPMPREGGNFLPNAVYQNANGHRARYNWAGRFDPVP
jgi:hypothetical protein